MSSNPSNVEDPMAVEADTANESAAAPQETAPGAMLTDEDLESTLTEDASRRKRR